MSLTRQSAVRLLIGSCAAGLCTSAYDFIINSQRPSKKFQQVCFLQQNVIILVHPETPITIVATWMKKSRKIASARQRARRISRSVPFHQLRTELDPETQEMHLVHDGRRWPLPDEPVDEYTAALALERADALHIAGHYLRQQLRALRPLNEFGHQALPHGQVTVSTRVVGRLAEMLDPGPDCALPFVFAPKPQSHEIYKLNRYWEIGLHCLALQAAGFPKLASAIKKTTDDLEVSERDVYRGLSVIGWKPVKSKSRPKKKD
jgi:hypothetical protein